MGLLTGGFAFGLNGVPLKAYAHNPFAIDMEGTNGQILVLVQLSGGNDGLNTFIPYEDSVYHNKRPNVSIKKENVIALNDKMGLHPAMGAFKQLYDDSKLTVVQNVGYENSSRSHFRSTDIWLTASDPREYLYEGWVGRYLSKQFPDFPVKAPDQPMAIQIGAVESMLLQTDVASFGTVFDSPDAFFQLVKGTTADSDPLPDSFAGEELKFMRQIAAQSIAYSDIIKKKADIGKNTLTYPNTGLGRQLSIVADLISGGLETPVYLTTIGGFDTHANQVAGNNDPAGAHANLLRTVSDAVAAFHKDLQKQGLSDKVTIMTFSEFGRRVNQNGTMGTDHGTAAPLFVVGDTVRGGIIGRNPNLVDLDTQGDLKPEFDYRQIYASVLQDHLGVEAAGVRSILANKDFTTLPIFKTTTPRTVAESSPDFVLEQNFPNPFFATTTIKYTLNARTYAKLSVFDMLGQQARIIREGTQDQGNYTVSFDGSGLPAGQYLLSLQTDSGQKIHRMIRV